MYACESVEDAEFVVVTIGLERSCFTTPLAADMLADDVGWVKLLLFAGG